MDKLNMLFWMLAAVDEGVKGDDKAITTFTSFLREAIKSIGNAIASVQTPFMVAIGVVAGVTLLWRIMSSDDPNEVPRAVRSALIMVGGAAIVLYLVPAILGIVTKLLP